MTISDPVAQATYEQQISLPADWQGETFRLNFNGSPVNYPAGATAGTPGTPYLIRKASASADIVAALGQFVGSQSNTTGVLAVAAKVTGAGTTANPWGVTLVSKNANTPLLSKAADSTIAVGPITAVSTAPIAPATTYKAEWTVAGTIERDQKWTVTVGGTEYFFFAGSGGTALTPDAVAAGLAAKINGRNGLTATSAAAVLTVTGSTDPGTPALTILPPNPNVTVGAAADQHTIYTQTITLQGGAVGPKNAERSVEFGLKIVAPVASGPAVTPAQAAVGQKAEDQTWEVSTQAVGGTFDLTIGFQDRNPASKTVSVPGISWKAAPTEIQKQIQDAVNATRANALLDVPPKVFVSGMGTPAFPWRITFGNMGAVTVTTDGNPLKIELPSGQTGIPANKVPGVAGGLAATNGISNVIGSGKDDWIYGVKKASVELVSVGESEFTILTDKQTLKVQGDIDLVDGQAVLYQQTLDTADTINGLVDNAIYFVRVEKVANSASPGGKDTLIKFYATREESLKSGVVGSLFSSALKLSKEATNAGAFHKLLTVPVADGAAGDDRIIGANGNLGGALFGGTGVGLTGSSDTLVGGAGADYLSGGSGADTLFGDGSHVAVAGIDGVDTLSGGAGNDHVFGLAGNDALSGGGGNDYLVGGAGSDVVDGGSGNDTLAVIEKGKSTDYDILKGGKGTDQYLLKADWGVANIVEPDPTI